MNQPSRRGAARAFVGAGGSTESMLASIQLPPLSAHAEPAGGILALKFDPAIL